MCRKTRSHWIFQEADSPGETRCKKFWDQSDENESPSLRNVKQVSGKIKDHRLEKYNQNASSAKSLLLYSDTNLMQSHMYIQRTNQDV